jgi:hypothetical protein
MVLGQFIKEQEEEEISANQGSDRAEVCYEL